MWRGLHHSNSNITISGFDKRRKGGPRVSALLEVNTYISRTLPITDVLSQFHSSSKRADVKPIESDRNLRVNACYRQLISSVDSDSAASVHLESMRTAICCLLLSIVFTSLAQNSTPATNVRVPDAATALSIAEPVLIKVYGKQVIDEEHPLKATLQNISLGDCRVGTPPEL